jgi:hypothetical protein
VNIHVRRTRNSKSLKLTTSLYMVLMQLNVKESYQSLSLIMHLITALNSPFETSACYNLLGCLPIISYVYDIPFEVLIVANKIQ